ncbi:START-like domain-containing protein [Flavobacteriales bacterium]|jgi:uncharacterized protein YndB with AHSA1/START domain|nr:START-like domain-containing protein [Flavobacteriales bacterium]
MIKFRLEYPTRSSKTVLYNCLSTPSGLSEWFADNVDLKENGKIFVFHWDGSEQEAEVLSTKDKSHIKFKWLDVEDEEAYFEFKIEVDPMTNDKVLAITDFADDEEEQEEQTLLWDSQVKELLHVVGG